MKQILILASFLVFLDQITKQWASKMTDAIILIPDLFKLELHHNFGIALSIPLTGVIQIILILIILILGGYYATTHLDLKNRLNQIILGGILGGAIGNLIDRFLQSYVIDFIAIWKFPVFNLADIFIFLSTLSLIYLELKREKIKTAQ